MIQWFIRRFERMSNGWFVAFLILLSICIAALALLCWVYFVRLVYWMGDVL